MNYFKAHRNKRPKRIFRRKRGYVSAMIPLMAITSAMSASQLHIMSSQPILLHPTKQVDMATQTVNAALAIIKIINTEKQRRFKATGRYEK